MEEIALFIVICLAMVFIGMGAGCQMGEDHLRKQAISLGYAHYNSTNGQWQWITNRVEVNH